MEELIEKAKKGDEIAFIQVVINMEKNLYKIAKTRLSNDTDIEDAVQDTILEAFSHIRQLKENSYFKTWLIRILINNCNKIYKKNKKFNIISYEKNEFDNYYMNNNQEKIDSNIDFDILLKKLEYKERLVIILYYLEDLTNEDISKILKVPVSTIKNRISRTRRKLKKILEEESELWII